jgi:hypothetical protein
MYRNRTCWWLIRRQESKKVPFLSIEMFVYPAGDPLAVRVEVDGIGACLGLGVSGAAIETGVATKDADIGPVRILSTWLVYHGLLKSVVAGHEGCASNKKYRSSAAPTWLFDLPCGDSCLPQEKNTNFMNRHGD